MTLDVTLACLGLALAVFAWSMWKVRQPHIPGKFVIISPNMVMFASLAIMFVMIAHLITLWTGVPFAGRN